MLGLHIRASLLTVIQIPSLLKVNPLGDIQVLAPMRVKGPASVETLNRLLQDKLNHHNTGRFQNVQGMVYKFRVGDRVMQTKNDSNLKLSNGDIGVITHISSKMVWYGMVWYGMVWYVIIVQLNL